MVERQGVGVSCCGKRTAWLTRDCATTDRVHREGGNGCPVLCVQHGYLGIFASIGDHDLQTIWISSGTDRAPVRNKEEAQARQHRVEKKASKVTQGGLVCGKHQQAVNDTCQLTGNYCLSTGGGGSLGICVNTST